MLKSRSAEAESMSRICQTKGNSEWALRGMQPCSQPFCCDRADRTGRWAKGKRWFVLQRLPIRAEEEGTCLPHGSPRIFKNNIQVWFTGKTGERLKHLICPYPPRLLQNAQAIAANLPGPPLHLWLSSRAPLALGRKGVVNYLRICWECPAWETEVS